MLRAFTVKGRNRKKAFSHVQNKSGADFNTHCNFI